MADLTDEDRTFIRRIALIAAMVFVVIAGGCWAYPNYNIYRKTASGRAQLAEAESNRRIAILEAQAKEESAEYLAKAEVARARGVAQSNEIIGASLKNNHQYLTWLWIETLKEGGHDVIYVPTEANLPILEAGRFGQRRDSTE